MLSFATSNARASRSSQGWPVISVDTKKKELIGNHEKSGQEWQPEGQPIEVDVHDFPDPDIPKAVPRGVYDQQRNEGWVPWGCSHDTSSFAVESIRRWWREMGHPLYAEAEEVLVCADSGGSNGYRLRLWKVELQHWANEAGLDVTVCHYPPGTSKWNKIEHRLFSEITKNWRGRPLESYQVVVNLIGATTQRKQGYGCGLTLTGSFIQLRLRSLIRNEQPWISILTTSMGSGTIRSNTTTKCND